MIGSLERFKRTKRHCQPLTDKDKLQLFKDIFKRNEKKQGKTLRTKIMFSDIENIPMIMIKYEMFIYKY